MPNRSFDLSPELINNQAFNEQRADLNATSDFRFIIQLSFLLGLIYYLLTNGAISLEQFFYSSQMN